MKTITRSCIRLHARAGTKDEAIRLTGQLLADAGYIEPAYIDSLLKREHRGARLARRRRARPPQRPGRAEDQTGMDAERRAAHPVRSGRQSRPGGR